MNDLDAGVLVGVVALQLLERFARTDQRYAAARDDTFFDRGAGRVQRVLDARFLLLHLDLSGGPDLDQRDPPASLATRSCSFSLS